MSLRRMTVVMLALATIFILFTRSSRDVRGQADDQPTPQWIWIDKTGKPDQTVYFRKSFSLDEKPSAVHIYGTCDDEMKIFVNGKHVVWSTDWKAPVFVDATEHVRKGENVIAVEAHNVGSEYAALVMRVKIKTTKESKPQSLVTNGSWRASMKAPKQWRAPKFDDEKWAKAVVVGKLGDAPWTQINARSLSAATKMREPEATDLNNMVVKKDFKVELLYTVPAESQGSWVSMTADPKGRLIVSDQYGKLYRVTPPAIGGDAKTTKVEPIPVDIGEAQGLLWAFDSLYVSVNRGGKYQSGLYRVRDTDGDDELDKVEMLRPLQGGGEHGPHAVLLSPDGKSLFVLCGNHTNLTKIDTYLAPPHWGEDSLLPRKWDARGHAKGRMAPGGWIARTDPEGKEWDLWCMGFRNQYDAAFSPEGELFTFDSDMEWDMNTPWYRPTRVCHCTSGAEFGWRGGTAKFPVYYPDNLPPVVDIGPGSPTGVVFGTGAKFPAKYQQALYICDWSYGKLYAVHLKPDGSSYKGELEEFVTGTPLPLTDIVVNPTDGAMYFAIGGRRVKSGLYRVTYVGKELTAPAEKQTAGAEARALRHKLESYHGKKIGEKAVSEIWPHLGHEDRFIRFAARIALEHQPLKSWQKKALKPHDADTTLNAILALTRVGPKSIQSKLLDALDRLDWAKLNERQKLSLLRIYGLAFTRMGRPDDEAINQYIKKFDPLFPAKSRELSVELCNVLVYLQSPNVAAEAVPLMHKALTQEEQMHYALLLRNLEAGWTEKLRRQYFSWFLKAANYRGGASFQGFVRNIRDDALKTLTSKEKVALAALLKKEPKVVNPANPKQRPFVKKWTMEELAPVVKNGLTGRDFDRGRAMFADTGCFSCHRFDQEGGATGPDLTAVSGRFSAHDLLESILKPSKTISDQYQAVAIELNNGQFVVGRIVNLAGNSLRVSTDLYDPNKLASVNRKQIVSMKPSPVSMMPEGLLDTLHREEILDLLAYMLSGGNRNHPMFQSKK